MTRSPHDLEDLDDQLRAAFAEAKLAAPTWSDPVSRVEGGVVRRRRRRLAAQSCAVAVALIAGIAAFGLPGDDGVAPSSGVYDLTGGAPYAGAPQIQRRSARADAPHCPTEAFGDIEWIVQSAPWGDSTGFALRNPRDQRCTISGTPTVRGVDTETGQLVDIPVATRVSIVADRVRQSPATVDPGELARVEIHGQTDCAEGQALHSYRELELVFEGRIFPVPAGRGLNRVCAADVTPWYVEPPMENAAVNVSLEAPRTLHPGEQFSYQVRIDNVFARSLAVPSCPVFQLSLPVHDEARPGAPWQQLACDYTKIAGHSTVRYRLTGRVPEEQPLGRTTLQWLMVLPDGEVGVADRATDGFEVTITR